MSEHTSIKISKLYLSDEVYLTSQTSSSYEIEQLSNEISRHLSSKLDLHTGGAISGNIDIVDANLSINTFENIYDVADNQSLAEKISNKQDKILSVQPGIITTGIYASQHIYDGIYLSTGTGSNPKRLYYPNITADATIAIIGDISNQLSNQLSNYLDKREDAENIISSYNEFTNSSTFFELEDGPQIGFNIDRNVDVQIGGKYYIMPDTDLGPGSGILSNELSVVRGEGSDQLTAELIATRGWPNLVTKTNGGLITADVGIVQHNLNILSGNYIQTNTPENIHIYTQNGFVQAQKTKYGDVSIGSKGYCILSVLPTTNQIIISGLTQYTSVDSKNYYDEKTFASAFGTSRSYVLKQMLKNPSMTLENIALSDLVWSVGLFDDAFSHFGSITAIELSGDNTVFTFDSLPAFRYLAEKTIEDYKADFIDVNGDNALYVPGFPELGNQEVPQFFSQHVEGGSSKAIGKFSHAEGRDTLADSRYSHAEGTMTLAGGIASHTEGQDTIAYGRSSHAEGEGTKANGIYGSHAEGHNSEATGESSHAEGYTSKAFGQYSHAEGNQTQAHKTASHTEGQATSAKGSYSHAEGYQSKTGETLVGGDSEAAHAEGYQTYADGDGAHSEGRETKASNNGAHAEGYKSEATNEGAHAEGGIQSSSIKGGTASGKASHAEGRGTTAEGEASHAEGINTHAIGSYSHAEGGNTYAFGNYAHAEGDSVSAYARAYAAGYASFAKGEGAHAEGSRAFADGNYCHAEGGRDIATGTGSHVEGYDSSTPAEITATLSSEADCQTLYIKGKKEKNGYKIIYVKEVSAAFYTTNWTAEGTGTLSNNSYVTLDRAEAKLSNYTTLNCVMYRHGAYGEGAHTEGQLNVSNGIGAHAEGGSTRAIGNYCHAEGNQSEATGDRSHAEGWNTRASAEGAHAEGSACQALAKYAHAEGYYTEANNIGSHAAGFKAKANANYSWCWNGDSSKTNYTASNEGTFCINPKDSISGFYIGADNFVQCVLSAIQSMDEPQIHDLKTVLGLL